MHANLKSIEAKNDDLMKINLKLKSSYNYNAKEVDDYIRLTDEQEELLFQALQGRAASRAMRRLEANKREAKKVLKLYLRAKTWGDDFVAEHSMKYAKELLKEHELVSSFIEDTLVELKEEILEVLKEDCSSLLPAPDVG